MKPVLLNIKRTIYNVLTKIKVTNNFIMNLFSNLPFNNFSKRGANDPAVRNPRSQALLEEESTPLLLVCVLILTVARCNFVIKGAGITFGAGVNLEERQDGSFWWQLIQTGKGEER